MSGGELSERLFPVEVLDPQQPRPLQEEVTSPPQPQPYIQESLFGGPQLPRAAQQHYQDHQDHQEGAAPSPAPNNPQDPGSLPFTRSVTVSDQQGNLVDVAVPQRLDTLRESELRQQQQQQLQQLPLQMDPAAEGHSVRYRTTEGWTDPMCDCWMYCNICLCSAFFTPCRFSTTASRSGTRPYYAAMAAYLPLWIASATFLVWILFITIRFPFYFWIGGAFFVISLIMIGTVQRGVIRQRYSIQGTVWEDTLAHICCICCAIAQEAIHVDKECGFDLPGDEDLSDGVAV